MQTKDKLLIVWSSGEIDVAKRLILLYGSVMLERKYWDEATIMVWGPSAKLIYENKEIQEQVKKVMDTGVKFNTCIVCSDEYGITKELEELGIEPIHTGEMLTNALKSQDTKVLTF
ncbi:MAG: DsrE family protein [Thiovulaceae bacterium]|nr:DsrE family protein [Sulfurimonadaceae bacterium]